MIAAILNSTMLDSDTAILDSDTFLSSLRFTQKHSPSTLNQTNSIWLTWWWLPSWILPSSIQSFCTKLWLKLIQSDSNSFILTQLDDGRHLEFCHLELGHLGFSHLSFSSQTHSHLPRLVPTICTKKNLHSFILTQLDDGSHLEFYYVGFRHGHVGFRHLLIFSQIHSKTLSLHSDSWLKVIQSDSNLFILTQLDDGSHLEFYHVGFRHCHLGFRHLLIFSQIHSKTLSLHSDSDSNLFNLTQTYSFSLNLLMAAIFNSAILDSATLVFPLKLTHTCQDWFPPFAQKKLHSHFPPHHLHKKNFTHSFWLNLMMAAILNSAILDSYTLFSSLRFTQKHSHSTLTLTQTNSIWLKLIHFHSTWWWQPSWILPSWIWPSWIQPS